MRPTRLTHGTGPDLTARKRATCGAMAQLLDRTCRVRRFLRGPQADCSPPAATGLGDGLGDLDRTFCKYQNFLLNGRTPRPPLQNRTATAERRRLCAGRSRQRWKQIALRADECRPRGRRLDAREGRRDIARRLVGHGGRLAGHAYGPDAQGGPEQLSSCRRCITSTAKLRRRKASDRAAAAPQPMPVRGGASRRPTYRTRPCSLPHPPMCVAAPHPPIGASCLPQFRRHG